MFDPKAILLVQVYFMLFITALVFLFTSIFYGFLPDYFRLVILGKRIDIQRYLSIIIYERKQIGQLFDDVAFLFRVFA